LIQVWYFWLVLVGIFLVFIILIPKENLVGTFCYQKFGGNPLYPQKGALAPFFPQKGALAPFLMQPAPLLREKMSSRKKIQKRSFCQIFKKEFPPKLKKLKKWQPKYQPPSASIMLIPARQPVLVWYPTLIKVHFQILRTSSSGSLCFLLILDPLYPQRGTKSLIPQY
jgi:hypothetical protein